MTRQSSVRRRSGSWHPDTARRSERVSDRLPPLDPLALRGTTELPEEAFDRASRVAEREGSRVIAVLPRLGIIEDSRLASLLARVYDLPLYAEKVQFLPEEDDYASLDFYQAAQVWPLERKEDNLLLGVVDPTDSFTISLVRLHAGVPLRLAIITPAMIEQAARSMRRDQDAGSDLADTDIERLKDMASDAPVVREVDAILRRAILLRASDIHLSVAEDSLRLRYRVNGQLRDDPPPARDFHAGILSRLKIMARLDIGETRLPQDGKFQSVVQGKAVDFRLSTMPASLGEGVAIRVLDRSHVPLDLDRLGIAPFAVTTLRDALVVSSGMVLVTGPTGSGKTSTLYAALSEINTDERHIVTVEDPVEHKLAGVSQIQIRPEIGLDFARVLRSILRQDPDILMVGEIRDAETAQIAAQAALTGHLVLATLHTNDAATAPTRLVDMGVEPYLVASVLRAVFSQRLVPRLCSKCCVEAAPSVDAVENGSFPAIRQAHPSFVAKGCEGCEGIGRSGRVVVAEVMPVTARLREPITRNVGTDRIAEISVLEGGTRFEDDALRLVREGLISRDDALAVLSGL